MSERAEALQECFEIALETARAYGEKGAYEIAEIIQELIDDCED